MTRAFERTPTVAIESPCILVCTLDTASGLCLGCGRTSDEIASWTRLSPAARRAVMAELPQRLARLER
ncbi:DUF1289 domain-containing protein [Sphingomonas spermidinifaciens]|uniref:DUF1289 domain-containing protein n=1 Tax=Sphingomonas spermidinifaciens TaxID=1141889 RepID=A0A2A4B1X4_9SPHN|nr:DUF1289 domain-containing protein [Sphingomonas spermidinifaciens]PCD01636.1 DUF1289 domain-containing protein [Sphingomonas spermidinifaciens]